MARFLLISNGHGEDVSGALIGIKLQGLGHKVDAIPFVGKGNSYTNAGIKLIFKSKEFSTGGIGYTSLKGRLTEIFEGQLIYLLIRIIKLLIVANNYDVLIVVGDVVPVFAAWLTRKTVCTYLVAYSSHYEGKLTMPWPCKTCLKSQYFKEIYTRDQLSADDLKIQLHKKVRFLGNPFMDSVLSNQKSLSKYPNRLGLFPGSRRPELDENLNLLFQTIEHLPSKLFLDDELSIDMALVERMDLDSLKRLVSKTDWHLQELNDGTNVCTLNKGLAKIKVHRDAFVQIVQSSDVIISMAGTATEQAVGLGKPVVQLPGKGPQFTSSFAEAQRRLLGPTLFCANEDLPNQERLLQTARLINHLLIQIKEDNYLQQECIRQANLRLGKQGGTTKICQSIINSIQS